MIRSAPAVSAVLKSTQQSFLVLVKLLVCREEELAALVDESLELGDYVVTVVKEIIRALQNHPLGASRLDSGSDF
jgi:hypothetical protein